MCAAKEAKAHDLAGDNPKDFDPFKDAERAAQKAAALAAATVNNLNLKDMSSKVSGHQPKGRPRGSCIGSLQTSTTFSSYAMASHHLHIANMRNTCMMWLSSCQTMHAVHGGRFRSKEGLVLSCQ